MSLRVHPDKNPAPDARAAFDALNAAHRTLLDHAKQARARCCARVLCVRGLHAALMRAVRRNSPRAALQGEYVREEGEKQLQQLTHDQPARVCCLHAL